MYKSGTHWLAAGSCVIAAGLVLDDVFTRPDWLVFIGKTER